MKEMLSSAPFIHPPSAFILAFTPSLTVGLLPARLQFRVNVLRHAAVIIS